MNLRDESIGKVVFGQNKQKLLHRVLSTQGADTRILSYEELLMSFRKGLRNGNWRKLNFLEKALFRASLWYAKHRGNIVNAVLMGKLPALVEKLKETEGMRIFKKGFEKAVAMLKRSEEKGAKNNLEGD